MFDPCGTRRLDGEEIVRRLAKYLQVDREHLIEALVKLLLTH